MSLGSRRALLAAAGSGGGGELVAFGGIMNEYTTGGTTYRFHVFRSDGKFEVVGEGDLSLTLLVVAGGGGAFGSGWGAGGGGVYSLESAGGDHRPIARGEGAGHYSAGSDFILLADRLRAHHRVAGPTDAHRRHEPAGRAHAYAGGVAHGEQPHLHAALRRNCIHRSGGGTARSPQWPAPVAAIHSVAEPHTERAVVGAVHHAAD